MNEYHINEVATRITRNKESVASFLRAVTLPAYQGMGNGEQQLAAARNAVSAIGELLRETRNSEGERIAGLLLELLGKIAPDAEAQRTALHNVKAATAYLLEYLTSLPRSKRLVHQFASQLAHILSERGFPFSGKNAVGENERGIPRKMDNPLVMARAETIKLWRRRYRTASQEDRKHDQAASIFKRYQHRRPFPIAEEPRRSAEQAIAWWYEELAKNGC